MHPEETPFIALDTETGGLDSSECALLSIAAVPSIDFPPFSIHILPQGIVEPKAAQVNGYTLDEWIHRGAVTEKVAAWEFQRWLYDLDKVNQSHIRRYHLAAHNAGFDALFLLALQQRTGIDLALPGIWHCTKIKLEALRNDGTLPPGKNNLDTLGQLTGYWDIDPRTKAHDALQDARCVRHSLPWLLNQKKKGPPAP